MNLLRRCFAHTVGAWSSADWRVFGLQMAILLVVSILLNAGFSGLREWRGRAESLNVAVVLRAWDGWVWYTWLAAAPVMLAVIRAYPLVRGRILSRLGIIGLWSSLIYVVVVNLRYLLKVLSQHDVTIDGSAWLVYLYNTFSLWPIDFLSLGCFFAVTFSLDYQSKYRRRVDESIRLQVRTAQLESELSRAELAALRGQLHPHFLFNSFNALATLVRQKKNDQAVEIIAQLSALLRLAIDRVGFQQIPLSQEIDFAERYLLLEQVRFGDRLQVSFDVDETALEILVPNILLQPLVENAIKHGIARQACPGKIHVSARPRGGRLHIEIINDGPVWSEGAALPSSIAAQNGGIGESNTRARLEKLFGPDYMLTRTPREGGGAIVVLNLPWHLPPASQKDQ